MPAQPERRRSREPRGSRRSSRPGRRGSLRGGAGVGIIAASAAVGAAATIATRAQPGELLGGCIVVGTVAAALTVRPRAGRMIFPVPALSYLIAALIAGIVYNRSTSKTELVIGAAQWVANGFFLMALATVLAIAVIVARWYLTDRGGRGQAAADWPGSADGSTRRARGDRDGFATGDRDQFGTTGDRGTRAARGDGQDPRDRRADGSSPRGYTARRPQGSPRPDQRDGPHPGQQYGPYPEQRPGRPADRRPGGPYDPQPGSSPYNFSSGA